MRRSDTEIARSGFGEFTGGFTGRDFLHERRPN
jgi:hypothetical protein